jgi:poly(3-hydroxybutyrate) depolymerase
LALTHIWPGGKNPLPEFILGKATNRLSANDTIWEFFEKHPKMMKDVK